MEDKHDDEVVEYFTIAEYTNPTHPTLKGPTNWIPFKEMFFDDNFLVAVGLWLEGDKDNSSNISKSCKSSKTLSSNKYNFFFAETRALLHKS